MLLAFVLRLHDIDRAGIWVDEANSILTGKQPFSVILDLLKRDSSPPFYYFLLRLWMGVAGDGPTALRLLSVVCSLILIGVVYLIGAREYSRRAGLWAAFLVAIAPAQVLYSQQVRMYTLLPLFSLTAWWFLVRYLRHGRARDFGLSMAATAAALYTHNFAVYVPLVHVVLVLVSGQIFRRFRMWVFAVGVLLLAYAPWIPTLLDQVANRYHYAWYLPLWKEYGLLGAAFNTLKSYSPAGSFIIYENVGALEWYGVPAIVSTSFAVWGAIVLARKRGEISLVGAVWLPAACVVPMAAAFAVSSILTPHYVPGRVDQMMFPCFALLAAVGLAALDPAWLRRAIVPMFLAVAIIGKGSLYPDYREFGFDGTDADLAEAVLGELRPGDVVLCTSLTRASLEYYLRRAGADVPIFSFPRTTARHLGAQDDLELLADKPGLVKEAGIVLDRARALAGPRGRLILVRAASTVNDPLMPGSLKHRFDVHIKSRLGSFVQVGTEERVFVTVNLLSGSGSNAATATTDRGVRQ
jgi:hypothetical protein